MTDNNDSGAPTSDEVLAALDQTGFILEYRVANKLRDIGAFTLLNQPFIDPDTGKSREADVIAHFNSSLNVQNIPTEAYATLVIECKRYDDPLVIVGENGRRLTGPPLISFDPLQIDFPNLNRRGHDPRLLQHLRLHNLPSHSQGSFIGSQLIKMNRQGGRWRASNDAIYDSIVHPLSKATAFELKRTEEDESYEKTKGTNILARLCPTVYYVFPLLVTSGNIYTVEVTSDSSPIVTRSSWASLVRSFYRHSFRMDVVSFSHLDEYVEERVKPVISEALERLAANINFFNPEWLQEQYGNPTSDPIFHQWLVEFNKRPQD